MRSLFQSLSHLRLIELKAQTDSDGIFMFSCSTVVLLIRPRSHWGRFWELVVSPFINKGQNYWALIRWDRGYFFLIEGIFGNQERAWLPVNDWLICCIAICLAETLCWNDLFFSRLLAVYHDTVLENTISLNQLVISIWLMICRSAKQASQIKIDCAPDFPSYKFSPLLINK